MDKHKRRRRTAFLLIIVICFCFSFVSGYGDEQHEEKKKPSISEMIKCTFSVYTTPICRSYWDKLKALMNQAQAYFFPPNLDFRGSEEAGRH
ncbi:hypothetical protein OWV82_010435 [Melia azedarach]|uniref:Uncharacterized protein n=1 Tax=Melia azedarach TaxID=155640 RepID=A0ACC1Y781_MELAZ|nr:hypothetical protein OWV82_010435 [Melia azedarach]